jgi:hypothetical protein
MSTTDGSSKVVEVGTRIGKDVIISSVDHVIKALLTSDSTCNRFRRHDYDSIGVI